MSPGDRAILLVAHGRDAGGTLGRPGGADA